jgi:hypothetical protein
MMKADYATHLFIEEQLQAQRILSTLTLEDSYRNMATYKADDSKT